MCLTAALIVYNIVIHPTCELLVLDCKAMGKYKTKQMTINSLIKTKSTAYKCNYFPSSVVPLYHRSFSVRSSCCYENQYDGCISITKRANGLRNRTLYKPHFHFVYEKHTFEKQLIHLDSSLSQSIKVGL